LWVSSRWRAIAAAYVGSHTFRSSEGVHQNRWKNVFYFHVRFLRVFALLGASVMEAGAKTPGTRR